MKVKNLRAYLANVGLTAHEFAKVVDCTPKYLYNIMNGYYVPGGKLAKRIFVETGGVVDLTGHDLNVGEIQSKKAANS